MKKTLEEQVGVTVMEVFELQFHLCSAEDQRTEMAGEGTGWKEEWQGVKCLKKYGRCG